MKKIIFIVIFWLLVLSACALNKYDTLKKGDKIWIFDMEDSGFGRVAMVVSNSFGKDYFGNNNQCMIKFSDSGSGCRGVMLHSIVKIHNEEELQHYLKLEQKVLGKYNDK